MDNDELEQILRTISELPDESMEMILPTIEEEFAKLADDEELINKTKDNYLSNGVTIKDLLAEKQSYDEIEKDFFKTISPTSPKGRYIIALLNAYKTIIDKIIKQGFAQVINVQIEFMNENAMRPVYAHPDDAGCDVFASEEVEVAPHETKLIHTGIKVAIPNGYEIQVRPRSGLSLKTNTKVTLGTIDSGYRGEVGIIFTNYGETPYLVKKGDRIAQLVIAPVYHINFLKVDKVEDSERGENGFGSTDEEAKN